MKSKLILLLAVVLMTGNIFSQKESVFKEERDLKNFTSVNANSGIDVVLIQDDEFKVIVEATKSSAHRIITEVKDGTLHIYVEGRFNWNFRDQKTVYVSAPNYERISAGGGSDIKTKGTIRCESLNLNSSGGADIFFTAEVSSLNLNCSGGGDITVQGEANNLVAKASGGADIDAKKLIATKVVASASGGGDVYVNVTEKLEASASGGGDVHYTGSPNQKEISESGGGDVSRF